MLTSTLVSQAFKSSCALHLFCNLHPIVMLQVCPVRSPQAANWQLQYLSLPNACMTRQRTVRTHYCQMADIGAGCEALLWQQYKVTDRTEACPYYRPIHP